MLRAFERQSNGCQSNGCQSLTLLLYLSVQMCAEDHAFQFYSNFLNVAVTVASYKKETFCIKHIIERQISPKDQHLPIPH